MLKASVAKFKNLTKMLGFFPTLKATTKEPHTSFPVSLHLIFYWHLHELKQYDHPVRGKKRRSYSSVPFVLAKFAAQYLDWDQLHLH